MGLGPRRRGFKGGGRSDTVGEGFEYGDVYVCVLGVGGKSSVCNDG